MIQVQCNRLDREFKLQQEELEKKALEVLRSGWYILGRELNVFEEEFAAFLGCRYCVGVANGLDALKISFALLGIGKGDEVIVPANTYIASVIGVTANGAAPIFVEPDIYYNIDTSKIEEKITERTKAILVVHLYGQAANMEEVMRIAKEHKLRVLEDCAQAHGAEFNGKKVGTFGDMGCFSFYPTKNLGGFGDGGAIVTNKKDICEAARIFRNYGSDRKYYNKVIGTNSRLDEIQAGLLRVRLKYLTELNEERRNICNRYQKEITNINIIKPIVRERASCVWHQYVVRTENREKVMGSLLDKGIHTMVHYPIPPHLSEAYSYLYLQQGSLPITESYAEVIFSLPLYNGMYQEEIEWVIETVNKI